jgi:hypothetical protein
MTGTKRGEFPREEMMERVIEQEADQKEEKGMTGKKATPKIMKLVDPRTGKMECKVCGAIHYANLGPGGSFVRGSWQCVNKCRRGRP